MPHALQLKLTSLRARVRRLLVVYGASWTVGLALVGTLACCLLDYVLRFQDHGVRAIVSCAWLAFLGWSAWRFAGRCFAARLSDVDLALKVERSMPALRDRLASSLEFLEESEDDPLAGSAALRRQVISQTAAAAETLDFSRLTQAQPARRAAMACAALAAVVAAMAVLNPAATSVALARLVAPWGATAWPQANNLSFDKSVERLATGSTFEVEVIDEAGAPLPDDVHIRLRFAGDASREVIETVPWIDDRLVLRKENVTRAFDYAVEGGDHRTLEWHSLQIVEPPMIDDMQVVLHSPSYTGWAPRAGEPSLRALVGTRVEFKARTTKALRSARVAFQGGASIAANLADDGFGFTLPATGDDAIDFVVSKSGTYAFDLQGDEGYPSGPGAGYEIRALEDAPPAVALEQPRAHGHVTAQASVVIRVRVADDLAVRRVSLVYSRSDKSDQPPAEVVLFEGPAAWQSAADSLPEPNPNPEPRYIDHRLDLAPLELPAGAELTILAAATDYRPQSADTQPKRLTVVPLADLLELLARRQDAILNELARLLTLERECRAQVDEIEGQLARVGSLRPQDVDRMKSAAANQRQVDRGLVGETEGVAMAIAALLEDLADNRIDSPELQRRMEELRDEIARLARDHLPNIDRELTSGLKEAQILQREAAAGSTVDHASVGKSLQAAGASQDETIRTLEALLGDLADFDNYRRFHREVGQLARDQKQLADRTADLARQTLGRTPQDLEPQQQSDLAGLCDRQTQLAGQFEKIQQRMQQYSEKESMPDAPAPDALKDALDHARQRNIGGQMRQTAQQVASNRVDKARRQQSEIGEDLQEMLDILANRRELELARLVKKLREAEQQLDDMQQRQQELQRQFDEASRQPMPDKQHLERLAREQRELQAKADQLARKLARLQAENAQNSLARGSSAMGQAGQQGEQGRPGEAAQQAQQAQKDLQEARKALAERRRQAEQDLAEEQMARLETALQSLHARQEKLLAESRHYEHLRAQTGELTRPQTQSVQDLGRQQRNLGDETQAIARKMAAAAVFEAALTSAAAPMLRAAERLAGLTTDAPVQADQQQALRRLKQVLDALQPLASDKPQDKKDSNDKKNGGGEGPPPKPPADQVRALSELVLLKLMQQDVQRRTQEIDSQVKSTGATTPEQSRELADLSAEQGRLADLLVKFEMPEPAADQVPADLPAEDAPQGDDGLPPVEIEPIPGEEP